MELKITKDKVLAAAAKCSTAKATLETLFPEVFEEEKGNPVEGLKFGSDANPLSLGNKWGEQLVGFSDFNEKGLWLGDKFKWEIKGKYLIPTRKTS